MSSVDLGIDQECIIRKLERKFLSASKEFFATDFLVESNICWFINLRLVMGA